MSAYLTDGASVEDVLSWYPCEKYDRERITALWAGRKRLTALDILDLPIPIEDRFWAVLRPKMIPDPLLWEWACWCAERALLHERKEGREPDPRSWAAIEARRAWLRGEIDDEALRAAWAAARDAARDAAWDAARAARDAAWDAAGDAAWDAAWAARDAARAAARDAARAAARDAARDAEREWQMDELRRMLLGGDDA
jgi:hypothetical protein